MNLIEVRDASFSYNGTTVLNGVNFNIKEGDYLCIVGENGSGKSTLLKGILRLKTPDSGVIFYEKNLKKSDLGYLSQRTAIQKDFPASVQEIILSGLLTKSPGPFYMKAQKNIAKSRMEQLGIYDLRKRCFRELSGGQQQRVLLARALCASNKLIIMDEPFEGLDPLFATDMYKIISEMNKNEGLTVIMVSHDIKKSIEYTGHILHLENEQLFWGTASQYEESMLGKAFLERN